MKMMTKDDIQSEFGWNDKKIHSLVQARLSSRPAQQAHRWIHIRALPP
jgi:hypothetical protein